MSRFKGNVAGTWTCSPTVPKKQPHVEELRIMNSEQELYPRKVTVHRACVICNVCVVVAVQ